MSNHENECGTGAVVVWQGRLWAVTYAPHAPAASSDKLYWITPDLKQHAYEGSVGGTHANRLIHRETGQLLIGPYVIDRQCNIRVIPRITLFGRLTGTARHLSHPESTVYYATMEEGLYEVDVRSLKVRCLIQDGNRGAPPAPIISRLPGAHGKGLYSGQGRLVFSNNGEQGRRAMVDPTIKAGALAEWLGKGDWQLVRRNQFTEITGPGGIEGSRQPSRDPIWALGWDAGSLILAVLHEGKWSYYRLPKSSHSYDGAHGWNTEWPRIREIGEHDLLATMHGTFWRFPRTFTPKSSGGIRPRSNYLKVVGDFCRWNDTIVLGCDDSARSEFLNKRDFKAIRGAPGQSNSNLWFLAPTQLDRLGPVIGRGSLWRRQDVRANEPSEPFLFAGYDFRQLCLTHASDHPVRFRLEVDRSGTGNWTTLRSLTVPAHAAVFHHFTPNESGEWIRITALSDARSVTAQFHYRNRDERDESAEAIFDGIASIDRPATRLGVMRSLDHRRLRVVASTSTDGRPPTAYDFRLAPTPSWQRIDDTNGIEEWLRDVVQPAQAFTVDAASVVIEEDGRRFRLPKSAAYEATPQSESHFGRARVCREVATERDLLNIHGTFYELPAKNAGGIAKLRPISSHKLRIHDFCSHNGLLFFTGLDASSTGPRLFRSPDGKAAVWAGVVDDLWKLGKPRGTGGPWRRSSVRSNQPSDPYLMTGYDRKRVVLWSDRAATIRLEVDIDGEGLWVPYRSFRLGPGQTIGHTFPDGFSAYWVRAVSDRDVTATVMFYYE